MMNPSVFNKFHVVCNTAALQYKKKTTGCGEIEALSLTVQHC